MYINFTQPQGSSWNKKMSTLSVTTSTREYGSGSITIISSTRLIKQRSMEISARLAAQLKIYYNLPQEKEHKCDGQCSAIYYTYLHCTDSGRGISQEDMNRSEEADRDVGLRLQRRLVGRVYGVRRMVSNRIEGSY